MSEMLALMEFQMNISWRISQFSPRIDISIIIDSWGKQQNFPSADKMKIRIII